MATSSTTLRSTAVSASVPRRSTETIRRLATVGATIKYPTTRAAVTARTTTLGYQLVSHAPSRRQDATSVGADEHGVGDQPQQDEEAAEEHAGPDP